MVIVDRMIADVLFHPEHAGVYRKTFAEKRAKTEEGKEEKEGNTPVFTQIEVEKIILCC